MTAVDIPDIHYETAAFERCIGLESVTIPSEMESVPPYMFSECVSLKNVTISEGVMEIGDSAFFKCSSLNVSGILDSTKASRCS